MLKKSIKKDIIIGVIGLTLLLVTAAFIFFSINFLVKNVRTAAGNNSAKQKPLVQFNIQGLKDLGIIK